MQIRLGERRHPFGDDLGHVWDVDIGSATPTHHAHLHIDLEAVAQGQGWGRRLMARFEDELRERGVPGLHLTVSATNSGAIAFYERLGLERRRSDADSLVLVRSLVEATD